MSFMRFQFLLCPCCELATKSSCICYDSGFPCSLGFLSQNGVVLIQARKFKCAPDPLSFKARYGKLLPLLTTQVDEGLMSTLAQFYDPLYHCFSFLDFQLLPTLEEYAHLVGIPILDQVSFSGLESIPTSREIADLLHIDESLIEAHMTTKGGIQGLPSEFLIAQATIYGKAMSEDAFEAIFVLLIYGLVLFPNIDKFVDVNAIRIFSVLNPVPTLLGDTYFSLHLRNAKDGGAIVCCLPLLYKWFISHLP
ncbi:hypothetical protein KIW84_044321 [Lathyrus oleraceus]|uniref:DUF7745 domain-containing protein n=1 Tax=Pisum sativum TaxID=3888 RepID=A0A9D4XKB5_PEA|nr:hypothetical protein KIW84_044321 [Pisum sativum]